MIEKRKVININDLFSDEEDLLESSDSGIKEIDLSQLVPFKNHPFKLYEGQRLNDMVDSIKEHGVILPLIVRADNNGKYEILSGHNRANAATIAGLERVPIVIKEGLTDEEAMLIVTESNLIQRSFTDLSYSEKARVLTEHYNAIKQQGKKVDLINELEKLSNADDLEENLDSCQFGTQGRSDKKVGDDYKLSARDVARYIKVDTLNESLKIRLDTKEIPFIAAVDLSFLKKDEQESIEGILKKNKFKVDIKKATVLKKLSQKRNLTEEKAFDILSGKYFDNPNKKPKSIKVKPKIISKYFSEGQNQKDIERIIEKALELYFSQSQEIENEDELEME
ncbi:ParB N-terminal domain-containing protein [Proteiniborus sp. MB09-C3]|uniref:ParB N-terminal domain-containing protein n=1 Tax=Proteiniborus sp. MB09-C3 TaxID=3050072 RepID=UPI002553A82A|nr:ParB N-terminal domain-containing protein [Proteiniborus sp. MB09-C3]WIV11175.1 ParB N-terminal domain-containing protein [Proteiniborus sp. MB09-C3]